MACCKERGKEKAERKRKVAARKRIGFLHMVKGHSFSRRGLLTEAQILQNQRKNPDVQGAKQLGFLKNYYYRV